MMTRKRFLIALSSLLWGGSAKAQVYEAYVENLPGGFEVKGTFSEGLEFLRYRGCKLDPSRYYRLIFEYRYDPLKSLKQVDIHMSTCTLGQALEALAKKMDVRVIFRSHNQTAIFVDADDHEYDEEFRKADEALFPSSDKDIIIK
jgi:hypothetical protein